MDSKLIDICYKKHRKQLNKSWDELAREYNYKNGEILRGTFKKYRKSIGDLKSQEVVRDEVVEKKLSELDTKEIELKKERIRLGDQRNKLNVLIRQSARGDSLKELLESTIKNGTFNDFEFIIPKHQYGEDNEMIIPISDCHYALTIDNEFEKYNTDVFLERLSSYLLQILDIKKNA